MSLFARRLMVLLLTTSFVLGMDGCSSKPKPTETGLSQQEADDLVQQVAALISSDQGGWMTEIQKINENIPAGTFAESYGMPHTLLDVNFTKASMNWFIHMSYKHHRVPADTDTVAVYDTSTVQVNGLCFAHGTIAIPAFGSTSGTTSYGRDSADVTVTEMTAYAASDTAAIFLGLCTGDTALTTFTDGGTHRYYYVDNIVEYDGVTLLRGTGAPAFPVDGDATVDLQFESLNGLQHLVPADKKRVADAIAVITFERGANNQTPVITITANIQTATTVYRYRIDLKTGATIRI